MREMHVKMHRINTLLMRIFQKSKFQKKSYSESENMFGEAWAIGYFSKNAYLRWKWSLFRFLIKFVVLPC